MKRIISEYAPNTTGPYSHGYEVNGVVCTSGQIGGDLVTRQLPEGLEAQAEQCFRNLDAILKGAGLGLEHVFKANCFLRDMKDVPAFNRIFAQFFPSQPARICVAVKDLPRDALCEVEVMAAKPNV